ncbi:NF-kappa-B inhibitor beta-like [Protopterus annectens]|uniref:NF-kappa-B inhibitor beta-like n=1 Tax=Protopterus annectens TaxID=7888 RepID=UPI001CF96079|nr:NF-kappa-B inhibitor beta-like [Protopterus annectens]
MANGPLASRGPWEDGCPPGSSWLRSSSASKSDEGQDDRVDSGLGSLNETSANQIMGEKRFIESGVGQVSDGWALGLKEEAFSNLTEKMFDFFDKQQIGIWQFTTSDSGQTQEPQGAWSGQVSKICNSGSEDSDTCYSQVDRLDSALGESITEELASSLKQTISEGSGLGGIQQGVETLKITDAPGKYGIFAPEIDYVLGYLSEDGDTALHLAVIHEHEPFLDYILQFVEGEDYLDVQNDLGQTALHIAVIMGLHLICEKLILAGAKLCIQERSGNTPLHIACSESHQQCVEVLLNCKGLPPRNQDQITLQLDCSNYGGYTALHLAIQKNDLKSVKALLSAGANINKQETSCGRSPLHLAVEAQNLEIVEWLLMQRADVNAKMCAGYTPMYSALFRPNEEIQDCLRKYGAKDPDLDSEESDVEDAEDTDTEYDDIFFSGAVV